MRAIRINVSTLNLSVFALLTALVVRQSAEARRRAHEENERRLDYAKALEVLQDHELALFNTLQLGKRRAFLDDDHENFVCQFADLEQRYAQVERQLDEYFATQQAMQFASRPDRSSHPGYSNAPLHPNPVNAYGVTPAPILGNQSNTKASAADWRANAVVQEEPNTPPAPWSRSVPQGAAGNPNQAPPPPKVKLLLLCDKPA
jgi:hypothetical protein